MYRVRDAAKIVWQGYKNNRTYISGNILWFMCCAGTPMYFNNHIWGDGGLALLPMISWASLMIGVGMFVSKGITFTEISEKIKEDEDKQQEMVAGLNGILREEYLRRKDL